VSGRFDAFAHRWGLERLAFRVWRYNPRGLLRLYGHFAFDRRLGVRTRGYGDLRYEPTPAGIFHEMIARIPFEPREFVFVDLGSGKGKVLMLAASYPFRRVIGVELWRDLHLIAVANLATYGDGGCGPIEPIQMDAADFSLPEEPLVLYFFNPFPAEVLARVLANVKESLSRAPRRVYLLFYAPVRRGTPWDRRPVFASSGFLEVLCDEPQYTIYTAS
jgi:hypothetical protein